MAHFTSRTGYLKVEGEAPLYGDDRPSDSNQGLMLCGLSHLERYGFEGGESLRYTVILERVATPQVLKEMEL